MDWSETLSFFSDLFSHSFFCIEFFTATIVVKSVPITESKTQPPRMQKKE